MFFSTSVQVHGNLLKGILLEDKSFLLPTRPAQFVLNYYLNGHLATYWKLNALIRMGLIYCQAVFLNHVQKRDLKVPSGKSIKCYALQILIYLCGAGSFKPA